jgi:ribonuclease Z
MGKIKSNNSFKLILYFSFILIENDLPGKFDIQKLQKSGIKPGPFCSKLKAGETVTLDDGRILSPNDYVGPSRPGRRLVILGDCSDASNIIPFAQQCDVLVHECTHDDTLREKALEFGHSTPSMATSLADKCDAKCLLLNHFSQRYRSLKENATKKQKKDEDDDNDEDEEDVTVDLLLEQAKQATTRPVFITDDFFTYTIPLQK